MTTKLHGGEWTPNPVLMKMLSGHHALDILQKLTEGWAGFFPDEGVDPLIVAHAAAATLLFAAAKVASSLTAQSFAHSGQAACHVCTSESILLHVEALMRERAAAPATTPEPATPSSEAN